MNPTQDLIETLLIIPRLLYTLGQVVDRLDYWQIAMLAFSLGCFYLIFASLLDILFLEPARVKKTKRPVRRR